MAEDVQPFPGTTEEATELMRSLAENCACVYSEEGVRTVPCPPHKLLIDDPAFAGRLVFARRRLAHLGEREE